MLKRLRIVCFVLFSWAVAVCAATAGDRCVVLVSVDGLAASYFDDHRAALPQLRALAKRGARAEGMVTAFPSVTWPSHVSVITGAWPAKHGVIGNSVLDRDTFEKIAYIGDPVFTKEECVHVETLYDAAHNAGLKTASIIWPATNGADTLDWAIPDSNQQRIHDRYTTPGFAKELDEAGISINKLGVWGWDHKVAAMRDATYARVASYLLRKYQPDLLLVHLITPDAFEHDFGPHVEEAYWACGNADDRIREIWETLQEPELRDKSTLFVVSDHGFAEYTRSVQPNVLFRQLGLVKVDSKDKKKILSREAWSHSSGGSAAIYLSKEQQRPENRKRLIQLLAELPGVDAVLDVDDFTKLGLPNPADNPQQADLMLAAKPGFVFSDGCTSDDVVKPGAGRRGAHGHLPHHPYMHATLIAAGVGIREGVTLPVVQCVDVAPTIARLLNVELPHADGRVLEEMLENK